MFKLKTKMKKCMNVLHDFNCENAKNGTEKKPSKILFERKFRWQNNTFHTLFLI